MAIVAGRSLVTVVCAVLAAALPCSGLGATGTFVTDDAGLVRVSEVEKGRWPQLLRTADERIAADPANAEAHKLRAWALYGLDRKPEALDELRSAVAQLPDHSGLSDSLCLMRGLREGWVAARSDCEHARSLQASLANLFNLGHTYLLDNDEDKARELYRESWQFFDFKLHRREFFAQDLAGVLAQSTHKDRDAKIRDWYLDAWEKLHQADGLRTQAEALSEKNDFEQAVRLLRRALLLTDEVLGADSSASFDIAKSLVKVYKDLRRYPAALAIAERVKATIERVEGHEGKVGAAVDSEVGLILIEMRRYTEAIQRLTQALRVHEKVLGPDHPVMPLTLGNLAAAYEGAARYQEALPFMQRAEAAMARLYGADSPVHADYLMRLADLHHQMQNNAVALPMMQRALASKEKSDTTGHAPAAWVRERLGLIHQAMGNYDLALPLLRQALDESSKDPASSPELLADRLVNLAQLYVDMGQWPLAEPLVQRALKLAEAVGGLPDASPLLLSSLAHLASVSGEPARALPLAQRAADLAIKQYGPQSLEVIPALIELADLHTAAGRYAKTEAVLNQARAAAETLAAEHPLRARVLSALASSRVATGHFQAALPLARQALEISQAAAPESINTAYFMGELGEVYRESGQYELALPLHLRALEMAQRERGPAHTVTRGQLLDLAIVYRLMGQYDQALTYIDRCLADVGQGSGLRNGRYGKLLQVKATTYSLMGRYGDALTLFQQSFDMLKDEKGLQHADTVRALSDLAIIYGRLGAHEIALPLHLQAVELSRQIHGDENFHTAQRMGELASAYEDMDALVMAKPLYEMALAINRRFWGDRHWATIDNLDSLARVHLQMEQRDEAIRLYKLALESSDGATGVNPGDVAAILNGLANAYEQTATPLSALPLYEQALEMLMETGRAPVLLSHVQYNLAMWHAKRNQPELAIYFLKQSVNGLQVLRAGNSAIHERLQRSFTERHSEAYLELADLLIAHGRFAEAQEVSAMLKEYELFEQVRRSGNLDPRESRIAYGGIEATFNQRAEGLARTLSATARELGLLRAKSAGAPLSAVESQRAEMLEAQLTDGRRGLKQYLAELRTDFAAMDAGRRTEIERLNVEQIRPLQKTLEKLGHGVVLLHYIMLEDKLSIILTTPAVQTSATVKVSSADLNREIQALREGIQQRKDVRASAQRLHDWLITPVAAELRDANAQTLMVALTGGLRYLPFAALHDGESWLVQRYAVSLYTEAARDGLREQRSPTDWLWQLQGFGLTRRVEGFEPLPGVHSELSAIIGSDGLPGRIRLDEEFTERSLVDTLAQRPPVVHLASHFVFKPGSEAGSFLLLGDGNKLSLGKIQALDFTGVELMTLSACETAMGGGRDANGEEIEGFGALAQLGGAYSVMATLWPVVDDSTARFMREFYLTRQRTPGLPKVEALRRAQLALIGSDGDGDEDNAAQARSARREDLQEDKTASPAGRHRRYAHPYYWAPFILMGNWL